MKLLIWLVVAWAVVVWMQRAKKNMARRARDAAAQAAAGADFGAAGAGGVGGNRNPFSAGAQPSPSQASPAIEQMVQCAQCGIHFPKSEAIQARGTGRVFCCTEHRELHALDAGAGVH
ncbi:hypothetical protein D9O50_07690 [Oxalobacteraceae bacterium CAVE-383]|nr:hypothetical protein D9O50_07690 [Oxalobacteraceae bacterium CAVE-383]